MRKNREAKRGQSAAETLVMAGFAAAFMLPLVFLFLSSSNSEMGSTGVGQAKLTARAIADQAGEVYLQGKGAKQSMLVNYPSGIVEGRVEGGLVVLTIDSNGQKLDVVGSTFANVKGSLPGTPKRTAGLQRINLTYVENPADPKGDYVEIIYG